MVVQALSSLGMSRAAAWRNGRRRRPAHPPPHGSQMGAPGASIRDRAGLRERLGRHNLGTGIQKYIERRFAPGPVHARLHGGGERRDPHHRHTAAAAARRKPGHGPHERLSNGGEIIVRESASFGILGVATLGYYVDPHSARRQASAAARMTAREPTVPSASPFSKSPSTSAIWLVTCAKHSTGLPRAAAKA